MERTARGASNHTAAATTASRAVITSTTATARGTRPLARASTAGRSTMASIQAISTVDSTCRKAYAPTKTAATASAVSVARKTRRKSQTSAGLFKAPAGIPPALGAVSTWASDRA